MSYLNSPASSLARASARLETFTNPLPMITSNSNSNSKNKENQAGNQASTMPQLVFSFRHHEIDPEATKVAILAPGHAAGPVNANVPINFDTGHLDKAWNTINPQNVNRRIDWQGTRLGAGSAQFRETDGTFSPVVWSSVPRMRNLRAPVQLLLATLVGGKPDWVNGAVPSGDDAAIRQHVAASIAAGRSHDYPHGFSLEAFASLAEILAQPGAIHPVTGEDTGRHWFGIVGQVHSVDTATTSGAIQVRYNCSAFDLYHLPCPEFGRSSLTPLDPYGKLNLYESLTYVPEVAKAATPVVLAPTVPVTTVTTTTTVSTTATAAADTRRYWNSFGIRGLQLHEVAVDSVVHDFDLINNFDSWREIQSLFRLDGNAAAAAVTVADAARYWVAKKMYGEYQPIGDLAAYEWSITDVKDLIEVIAKVGASRGLNPDHLPRWSGEMLQFGAGGPAFKVLGKRIYDYRGRLLQSVVELKVSSHTNESGRMEYTLDGLQQVGMATQLLKLVYFGYLPLLAQSITQVMDALPANFSEFCRNAWVGANLVSWSKDQVLEQNSAARLRMDNCYPMTIRQPYSPLSGSYWVRLNEDGRFAANLVDHYEQQIRFSNRECSDLFKEAIRVAYREGGLDYRFDKKLLVGGGLGAVNCRLLAANDPAAFAALQAKFGVTDSTVLSCTLKLAKGLKRLFLSMAQSAPVKGALPAGFLFRGQESPVEGFLAQVALAPTVVFTPGMSASVGVKPIAEVHKTVRNYVLHSFGDEPQFLMRLGCAIKEQNVVVSTTLGITRYTLVKPAAIKPGELLVQVANPNGSVNDVVHTSTFEGDLQWLEWEVAPSMLPGRTELKLSWEFITYESDMKARSIAKALLVDVNPDVIFAYNENLGDVDIIHFQDSLKVDLWWSYLMCAGTTLRYNWDKPEVGELRRLAVAINSRFGFATFQGILIDPVHIALGHYDAFQAEFRRLFSRPLWFKFAQLAEFGRLLYDMHQSPKYERVDLGDGYESYVTKGADPNAPDTNITSFVVESGVITEIWQRGMCLVGTETCPVYNVELFESTTPKENVGESWQFPSELRALQSMTSNGVNPNALDGLTNTIKEDILPNLAMAKILEGMASGSLLGGKHSIVVVEAAADGHYQVSTPVHARLQQIVKELGVNLAAPAEAFEKLSVRLKDVVFTFKVSGKDTSIWLPALWELNKLRSSNESGQTLSSVFYRYFLVPLCLNNHVEAAVVIRLRGQLSSLLYSTETPKLLKGRAKIGGRRAGLPCIPIGETWVLYSDDPSSEYQNALQYCRRASLDLEIGLNDHLVGYNSRAPLAAGWLSKLRVITPAENASNYWQLSPYYLGISPVALYIDGGDCDGDSGYWGNQGSEFESEVLDYQAVINIRNAGMDGDCRYTGNYAYAHYTRKDWAKATITMSSDCIRECVMTEEQYCSYNIGAHVVQHEAVGSSYKLYMLGEHLIDCAQAYEKLGLESKLLKPFMGAQAHSLVLILAEIYETILGGFSPEALELFERYLKPAIKQGKSIPPQQLTDFRKLLERFGANSLRAEEILKLINVISLVAASEVNGHLSSEYTGWDGLALGAAHVVFELGRGRFHGMSAFTRGNMPQTRQALGQRAALVKFYELLLGGLHTNRELYHRLSETSSVIGCGRVLFKNLHVELGLISPNYPWLRPNLTELQWLPEVFEQFKCCQLAPATTEPTETTTETTTEITVEATTVATPEPITTATPIPEPTSVNAALLETLKKSVLFELCAERGLTVAKKATKEQLVNALLTDPNGPPSEALVIEVSQDPATKALKQRIAELEAQVAQLEDQVTQLPQDPEDPEEPLAVVSKPKPDPKPDSGAGTSEPTTPIASTTMPTAPTAVNVPVGMPADLTPSQITAFELFQQGHNLVITGAAGTGKTYLSNLLRAHALKKNYKLVVVGSTGTSVLNIKGDGTLNSVFGLGLGFSGKRPSGLEADSLLAASRRSQICSEYLTLTDEAGLLIVVDEVSMVDTKLARLAWDIAALQNQPTQWVLIGDPGQCTPPGGELFFKDSTLDYEDYAEPYESLVKIGNFKCVALKEVVRQANDPAFLADLNDLRVGKTPGLVLRERFGASTKGLPEQAIHAYYNNADVALHNRRGTEQLIAAGAESRVYHATVKKISSGAPDWPTQFSPIEPQMTLAIGMPVMVRKNLKGPDRVLLASNGTTGVVIKLNPDSVVLKLKNGKTISIAQQELDGPKDGKGRDLGKYKQLPLHPAFAITGHKLQGLTLDEPLVVHLYQSTKYGQRAINTAGWLYVVCSRVTEARHLYFAVDDADQTVVFNWFLSGNRVDQSALQWLQSLE